MIIMTRRRRCTPVVAGLVQTVDGCLLPLGLLDRHVDLLRLFFRLSWVLRTFVRNLLTVTALNPERSIL
jgi:hypothetical protein